MKILKIYILESYINNKKMDEFSIVKNIHIIILIFGVIVSIVNVLLMIPIFKLQKTMHNVKALYFQFLFSFLLFSLSMISNGIEPFVGHINCYSFHIMGSFSGPPAGLSQLSIIFHSFFILTNNYIFLKNKQCAILIMVVITWIPSAVILTFFLIFMGDMQLSDCQIPQTFYKLSIMIFNRFVELMTMVLCGILIWKICTLNVKNDAELQTSKKKTVSKLMIYIITVIIGTILKLCALTFQLPLIISSILKVVLLLYFLLVNYIYLWNKHFQEACLDVYCCRNRQVSEENLKNNQKELIFQQEFNEEQPSFNDSQCNE